MPVTLTLGAPVSCISNQICTYSVTASGGSFVAVEVDLHFDNPFTGASCVDVHSVSNGKIPAGGIDLNTTPEFFDETIDSIPCKNLILPPICGNGQGVNVRASAMNAAGTILFSPTGESTELIRDGTCPCTELADVFTTLDSLNGCMGEDGVIGVEGKVFELLGPIISGGCGSVPSPLVNQTPTPPPVTKGVSIGLLDPATNTYYEYVVAPTDGTGTFSAGFGIKNRTDVVALIPSNGSKAFKLHIFYIGSDTHLPSPVFSKDVSISGNGGPVCNLGTLLVDTTFATATPGQTLHKITGSFTGKILALSDMDRAISIRDQVQGAIVSSGATPIEIKVYRGPDVQVPIFFGFGSVTAPAFNVVATAVGSPVLIAVIAAAILAIIIILAIFVIALWFIDQIVMAGGGGVLIAGAVAVVVVAAVGGGLALYLLSRGRVRRALR